MIPCDVPCACLVTEEGELIVAGYQPQGDSLQSCLPHSCLLHRNAPRKITMTKAPKPDFGSLFCVEATGRSVFWCWSETGPE